MRRTGPARKGHFSNSLRPTKKINVAGRREKKKKKEIGPGEKGRWVPQLGFSKKKKKGLNHRKKQKKKKEE